MTERVYFGDSDGTPKFEQAMSLSLDQKAPSGEGSDAGLVKYLEPP